MPFQCYVTDTLLSHGASQVSFQNTKCTKRSFRWTRCSRYHCKDVHHCGKLWQQTYPPQLTINSSNFTHLFLARRNCSKNIFYLKKIFFPKTPSRAFLPNFRHCPKNGTAQMLRAAAPPQTHTPMARLLHSVFSWAIRSRLIANLDLISWVHVASELKYAPRYLKECTCLRFTPATVRVVSHWAAPVCAKLRTRVAN